MSVSRDEERFRAFVTLAPSGCWEWSGAHLPKGYGLVRWDGRTQQAHRVAWTLANGPIPDGAHVLHRCDNPPCVNPEHLFLGTPRDNTADMIAKGRMRKRGPDRPRVVEWIDGRAVAVLV